MSEEIKGQAAELTVEHCIMCSNTIGNSHNFTFLEDGSLYGPMCNNCMTIYSRQHGFVEGVPVVKDTITELLEALQKTTQGEWLYDEGEGMLYAEHDARETPLIAYDDVQDNAEICSEADGLFIEMVHNKLPEILEELQDLREYKRRNRYSWLSRIFGKRKSN